MKVNFQGTLLAVVFSALVAYGISLIVSDSLGIPYVTITFLLTFLPACGVLGLTLEAARMTINFKLISFLILVGTLGIEFGCSLLHIPKPFFFLINGFLFFANLLFYFGMSKMAANYSRGI